MTKLLVISSAPVQEEAGSLLLDNKFLEGMRSYCANWPGEVHCILQKTGGQVPFGRKVSRDDLPFGLSVLAPSVALNEDHLAGFSVVLCSGDNHRYFHLARLCQPLPARLVYIIEYILETRIQIIHLRPKRRWLRDAYANIWTRYKELQRRQAFARADGLQANGYPAAEAYGPLNANTLQYLDNRIGKEQLANATQMSDRQAYLAGDGPLRIIHSGRLAPMKGSQDLVPIAQHLHARGVNFRLDIFGSGALEEEIRAGIIRSGLQDHVYLHGVVDFQSELVPYTCTQSDLFLSCHRQSDPSCSYLEAMGCGVSVAGYANRMWQALQRQSGTGWVAPLGDWRALADTIADVAADRAMLAQQCVNARAFAQDHTFEAEFSRRVAHLVATANPPEGAGA